MFVLKEAGAAAINPNVSLNPTWLCPTANHRDRFLDMQSRLRPARIATMAAVAPLAAAMSPKVGWPLLPAVAGMIAAVLLGGARLNRRARPELWVFASAVLSSQLVIAFAAALGGGPRTMLPCMLALPVLMVGTRFSNRGLIVGAPLSAVLVLTVTLGVDPGYVLDNPESAVIPFALVLWTAMYISALVASDVRHRADSTLDQLTGLLNRRALEPRFLEVAGQAALTGQPVSVMVADIDRFKRINDAHGHVVGDAVLRDVAYALRKSLRTFELLYRLGGEEFLLLLPGASEQDAAAIAESLRAAVESLCPAGLSVTCSFGVATACAGEIRFRGLMEGADSALYAAKRHGRNRVEQHSSQAVAAVA